MRRAIKRLYITFAVIGGLAAVALVYRDQLISMRERGGDFAALDPILLLHSLGLSLLFIPIGAFVGVATVGIAHLAWVAARELLWQIKARRG